MAMASPQTAKAAESEQLRRRRAVRRVTRLRLFASSQCTTSSSAQYWQRHGARRPMKPTWPPVGVVRKSTAARGRRFGARQHVRRQERIVGGAQASVGVVMRPRKWIELERV